MNLSVLRRTAAEIAAAAVLELFPDVELWGGGETATGFSYDFYFPHPIHAHLIEEKMRQIVKERRPIRTLEMVAFSARELLKKEGHKTRLEELEEVDKELVELIQIGDFCDLCEGPHLKNTAELSAFKIEMEALPDRGMRITGWCHVSKDDLKVFLKKLDHYEEPAKRGEKMGLWQGSIWLDTGLKYKFHLIQVLKKYLAPGALEVSVPADSDRLALHRSLGKPKVVEIWSSGFDETWAQTSFFNLTEEEQISSLQSIGKTLTILGFNHSTVSKGRETDYLVEDELGRKWQVVQVKKVPRKGSSVVDLVITAGVEKIFSLLLEKNLILQMVEL